MQIAFAELLRRAKSGDDEAVSELHERYAPLVLGRARRRLTPFLRRRDDTEDIRQSVFGDVLRGLTGVEDRGEAAFRHWLLIKVENKIRDRLRRQLNRNGQHRETALRSGAAEQLRCQERGPASEAARLDDRARIAGLLGSLDEMDRHVLQLRARQCLPFGEVARAAGLPSADAARMRYVRALVALRAAWKRA